MLRLPPTSVRYYPFGMIMPGRNHNDSLFRFGFNKKEKDDETYGQGNEYDYGFRIYNPRLGKFLSVDPLVKKYPMLTPYQFASNRPIEGIDLDGKEFLNSTTIVMGSIGGAGGIGYGGNVSQKIGTAYDMIGKTFFTAHSLIGPGNQDLGDGTSNPQMILGAEVGGDYGVQFVFEPTFEKAFNTGSLSASSVSAKVGVGVNLSMGTDLNDRVNSIGIGVGIGVGGSFKSGNQTTLGESFSITYSEVDNINNMSKRTPQSSSEGFSSVRVGNIVPEKNEKGEIIGYSGSLQVYGSRQTKEGTTKPDWYDTGIKMKSDAMSNKVNKMVPKQNWKSANYSKEEKK